MSDYLVVLVTAGSAEEAERIGSTLVREMLAACVNILPGCHSIFCWGGEVQKEEEVLMLIKTRRTVFERLSQRIIDLHSYEVPEIIALPVELGSLHYLNWLAGQVPVGMSDI